MARTMDKDRTRPEDLDINLSDGDDAEIFKWLMACLLFSAPISQETAFKTYMGLARHGYVSPEALAAADRGELVRLLGEGGYRRYDGVTSRKLIELGQFMDEYYGGSTSRIYAASSSQEDLEKRIQQIKGIGPKGTEIFLREMDGWT